MRDVNMMTVRMNKFCMKLLSLISVCCFLELVNAVEYGPSLVSLTRWDRLTRGPTIFNPDTGRVISLEDYPNYSVVIPLTPDSPTGSSNQVFISRRVSGPGEFHVEAPPGYGVMAVVQSLDLRVADDACNDFILFSEVDGGGGGAETTGTCGKVDIRDGSYAPQGLIGPRTFISPSGRMRVLFYHGFIWGLVRNFNFDLLDPSLNPMLRVEIVFTAFKDCSVKNTTTSQEESHEESQVQPNNIHHLDVQSSESFTPCSPSAPSSKTCINKELLCDLTLNCGFEQDFGSDEDFIGCHHEGLIVGYSMSQHSPPTTIASTTGPSGTTAETTPPSTTTLFVTSPSTTTEPSTELTTSTESSIEVQTTTTPIPERNNTTRSFIGSYPPGTGTDAVGLIGLVRKFSNVEAKHGEINLGNKSDLSVVASAYNSSENNVKNSTTTRLTTKMPFAAGGELFVDIKADPIENQLVDGESQEEILEVESIDDSMSTSTLIGILCVTALVLILIGALRVYYCYNKVIWNPHGSLPSTNENPPPPGSPNSLMKKIKALVAESEEGFPEKKKSLKEQPPSYEILFPLPGEKLENDESLKV